MKEYITECSDQETVDKMNKEFKMFKFPRQFYIINGKLFLMENPKPQNDYIENKHKLMSMDLGF